MFDRLRFAFSYALRNLIRDRHRSAFTLLCVAVGVATVVALRSLGLMLTDALTNNAQAFLRGDIRVTGDEVSEGEISLFNNDEEIHPFTGDNIPAITAWAERNNVEITFTLNTELMQAAVVEDGQGGTPALAMSLFIDPAVYPFYDTIRAEQPANRLLADLFTGPSQIVLGHRLASQIDAEVGDQVRISSAETLFTVTGIVPETAESVFENPASLMFSFVYLNRADLAQFGLEGLADRAYLKFPPGADLRSFYSQIRRWPTVEDYGYWEITNTAEVLTNNEQIADAVSRFVMLLSLVGLIIGGVGIINTMIVAVNRRSKEIAVLKSLGLQGADVSLVFLAEAFLSGILGSLLGLGSGILLSYTARNMGQQAFAMAVPWRIYGDPLLIGLALGVAVTVSFSFLPTIMATRVRPNLVLRENHIPLARAGCGWTLVTLVLLIVGFGLLVDVIIGSNRFELPFQLPPPVTLGIAGTFGAFVLLAVIVVLMWLLVWLLGRLPSFRNPNLRIALRGLTTHRNRTALSLLALIIGMTALSGTLIMARSLRMLLYTSISEPLGGNMVVLALPGVREDVHERLDGIASVNGYRDVLFQSEMSLEAIDGTRYFDYWFEGQDADPQAEWRQAHLELTLGVEVHGNPQRGEVLAGRLLGPEDVGQAHIVIPYIEELEAHGVGVGSTFTYRLWDGENHFRRTFEVVGVVAPTATDSVIPFNLNDYALQIPFDMMPRASGIPIDFIIVDVDANDIDGAMATVGGMPGIIVFDVTLFDSMFSRLLRQITALPILVAGLSLFAASALIATTVALATMERRRQIATLKAIGVSRLETLAQLLIENSIVGFTGGIISLLPTLLILYSVPKLTQGLVRLPTPVDLVLLMLLLSVLVTVAATLVTAWSASGERPLNALRTE